MKTVNVTSCVSVVRTALLVIGVVSLAACGGKDGKAGQAVVKVNGDEITVLQLNDELRHANPQENKDPKNAAAERKQVLDALVDRQLLIGEAIHNNLDRDPNILQSIERAKAQILAQAYLQSKMGSLTKPSKTDVEAYFKAHPEFFAERKIYEIKQLILAASDFNNDVSAMMDAAKSYDDVTSWLDAHKIDYVKSQAMRASSDMPQEILTKMQGADKPQLFVVKQAQKALIMSVGFVKDSPVTLEVAAPEIEKYLMGKKSQEFAEGEVKRLHSIAKIEYLNKADVDQENAKAAAAPAPAPAPAKDTADTKEKSKIDAGYAGLK